MEINSVILSGIVRCDTYSHNAHNLDFRKILIDVRRKSETIDTITVIYQEKIKRYKENDKIKVAGTLRSRREGKKLEIYVYADNIELWDGDDVNELIIEGHVCSEPYYKENRKRKITQMLICCENIRKTYTSVLAWKRTNLLIGDKVVVYGRMQSRIYSDRNTDRMINEISAYKIVNSDK